MIIFILCIQKVRQRGHLICPRTAGKQQGQGWNQAGWLQNLSFSPSPFERISSKSYWMADLHHLFPWPDQPLQRISILHMKHSNFVAIPTLLLVHLYQPLWIKPIYQKKKNWEEQSERKRAIWWACHGDEKDRDKALTIAPGQLRCSLNTHPPLSPIPSFILFRGPLAQLTQDSLSS